MLGWWFQVGNQSSAFCLHRLLSIVDYILRFIPINRQTDQERTLDSTIIEFLVCLAKPCLLILFCYNTSVSPPVHHLWVASDDALSHSLTHLPTYHGWVPSVPLLSERERESLYTVRSLIIRLILSSGQHMQCGVLRRAISLLCTVSAS